MPSHQLGKAILGAVKGLLKDLGHFSNPDPYKNQHYDDIRQKCLHNNTLFEDPEFPANTSSLFFRPTRGDASATIEWKRPRELCRNPRLYNANAFGGGPNAAMQGQLGNCWFVAACSVLSQFPNLRRVVIPEGEHQDFSANNGKSYAGIFHFRFYRFGKWVDVVIDDRLPTRNNRLLFVKSVHEDEFWSALVEKAYAKLAGSYEALDGGNLTDALVDFTGGVAETVDLENSKYLVEGEALAKDALFRQLQKELVWGSLMCAAITVRSRDEMEAQLACGLIKGHAYGITGVTEIQEGEQPDIFSALFSAMQQRSGSSGNRHQRRKIELIRLRNPWGRTEWNGAFSDNSPLWNTISAHERQRLGLVIADDGEFWIPFDDFLNYFSMLAICHIMYGSLLGSILSKGAPNWSESVFHSRWMLPERAGGCINNRQTFLKNPQFRFDIQGQNEEVMISVEQRDIRGAGGAGAQEQYLAIGFQLLKVEENRKTRVRSIKEAVDASTSINSRMVIMSRKLKPGRYVIIPTTFQPNQLGEFLLRIYTDAFDNNAKELSDELPSAKKSILGGLIKVGTGDTAYADVVYATVKSVSGVHAPTGFATDGGGEADYYCKLMCEDTEVKTPLARASAANGSPVWDSSAIFYRKHVDKPVHVQVWAAGRFSDQVIAVCDVDAPRADTNRVFVKQETLRASSSGAGVHHGGGAALGLLIIEIASYSDIMSV